MGSNGSGDAESIGGSGSGVALPAFLRRVNMDDLSKPERACVTHTVTSSEATAIGIEPTPLDWIARTMKNLTYSDFIQMADEIEAPWTIEGRELDLAELLHKWVMKRVP